MDKDEEIEFLQNELKSTEKALEDAKVRIDELYSVLEEIKNLVS